MKGSSATILLRNARAVLPERVSEKTNLLIQDGVIQHVFDSQSTSTADSAFDLEGLTLYPGFIDVHIHGAAGVDTMAAGATELSRVLEFLATQGVTGWLPTLVPAPVADYAHAVAAIAEASELTRGARILGVHYEGPFVNESQCGALRSRFFRTFSGPGDIDDLPVIKRPDLAHMITIAPEIDGGIELAQELNRRGWVVSIGHTRADFDRLEQAFAAGARHMTHFMNAMAPLHHRSPGPVTWGLLRDDVTCDFIADGIHLDPLTLQLLLKIKTANRLALISDSVAPAGLGDGDYEIWGETISVNNGRTRNVAGSIAGSVISMLDAFRLMKSLDVPEVDLARMASTNPARLLGIEQECGSIEAGKRADLVALDQEGSVRLTMVGGEVIVGENAV